MKRWTCHIFWLWRPLWINADEVLGVLGIGNGGPFLLVWKVTAAHVIRFRGLVCVWKRLTTLTERINEQLIKCRIIYSVAANEKRPAKYGAESKEFFEIYLPDRFVRSLAFLFFGQVSAGYNSFACVNWV
ncbi:MAG: hypothetical protein MPJ50_05375 [Pirellulales bacterium]|nr:hypothetical protein [Pirellulales bacterium]